MRDYFSFLGFTFIALLLFGIVNNFHLSQEHNHPGSFLEKFSFLLMFPLGLCSLPALILSLPILKIYTRLLESQFKAEADKKYNYLHVTSQRKIASLESKAERYEQLILEDRKRCREEGYRAAEDELHERYEQKLEVARICAYESGFQDGVKHALDFEEYK